MADSLDLSKLTAGPAYLKVGGDAISHTQGGVTINITPGNRNRTVDLYGDSPVAVIHTGDECRITAPLAQWTAVVLKAIYDPGADQTSSDKYLGIGRSAGYIYQTKEVAVVPVAVTLAGMMAKFWKCCPVGQLELTHTYSDDRVFNAEFLALVDESKTDGQLMGALYLEAPSGGGGET